MKRLLKNTHIYIHVVVVVVVSELVTVNNKLVLLVIKGRDCALPKGLVVVVVEQRRGKRRSWRMRRRDISFLVFRFWFWFLLVCYAYATSIAR